MKQQMIPTDLGVSENTRGSSFSKLFSFHERLNLLNLEGRGGDTERTLLDFPMYFKGFHSSICQLPKQKNTVGMRLSYKTFWQVRKRISIKGLPVIMS